MKIQKWNLQFYFTVLLLKTDCTLSKVSLFITQQSINIILGTSKLYRYVYIHCKDEINYWKRL